MKKIIISSIIVALSFSSYSYTRDYTSADVDKIRITHRDLPNGFRMAQIPAFARDVFRENPCFLDTNGIKRIAKHLYPNGDFNTISAIHSTIIAKEGKPFGDDLVCYIIVYRNAKVAQKELKKLTEYVEFNNQRATVTVKNNLAVFIHSDDVINMPLVMQLKRIIDERLESIGEN
ncbi:MAG: hypothetical protein N2316_04880 [Spirochaetes bacterium]|nr:hypothetical protein [Spirochaetota bacterium]